MRATAVASYLPESMMIRIGPELRLYDEEMDMMKQRNRVRDKLNDPLKKVTRKTITSNFYKIVNAKEAQFMIDLCK